MQVLQIATSDYKELFPTWLILFNVDVQRWIAWVKIPFHQISAAFASRVSYGIANWCLIRIFQSPLQMSVNMPIYCFSGVSVTIWGKSDHIILSLFGISPDMSTDIYHSKYQAICSILCIAFMWKNSSKAKPNSFNA